MLCHYVWTNQCPLSGEWSTLVRPLSTSSLQRSDRLCPRRTDSHVTGRRLQRPVACLLSSRRSVRGRWSTAPAIIDTLDDGNGDGDDDSDYDNGDYNHDYAEDLGDDDDIEEDDVNDDDYDDNDNDETTTTTLTLTSLNCLIFETGIELNHNCEPIRIFSGVNVV